MNRKKVKKILAWMLIGVMLFSMAGCGKKFDATAYVKASLDLVTRHDVDQYVEVIGVDKEEAEEVYEESITQLDDMAESMGDAGFPEELNDAFTEFIKSVMQKTKYTVKEAREDGDDIIVDVEVEPIMVFEGSQELLEESINEYVAEMQENVNNGAEVPTEDEIMLEVYTRFIDILNENLETAGYAEKTVISTKIIKNSDGEYEIDEDSFVELGAALIDLNGID